ncbi:MAG: hypothetical protein WBP93_21050 [Pyrinomonadaceae bacterium]
MSVNISRPPEMEALGALPDGLCVSTQTEKVQTLAELPIGAHLILRCRKDWRDATVVAASIEMVTLSVGSPSGRTYRVRRPPDTALFFDGLIPVLGKGTWRAGFARYDARW